MNRGTRLAALFAMSVAAGATVRSAPAQTTINWTNATGGNYNTAANWNPANVPDTTTEIARFALDATYSVGFTAGVTAFRFTVVQGNVTWNLNGNTFAATDTVNNGVGNNVTPTSLTVQNGNLQAGNFDVGGSASVVSSVILRQGGHVTVGTGAFHVGTSGTGTLLIEGGSSVTANLGNAGIGLNASGVGTVTVRGAGSALTVGGVYRVGDGGNGTLSVNNGASASFGTLHIGQSQLTPGTGVVNVSGGGAVLTVTGNTTIGGQFAGSLANSATLNVGGAGTVNLNGTTTVRSSGTINVTGGTLNLGGLALDAGATVNWTGGTVHFTNPAVPTAAVINTFLGGTGTLGANRTLSAGAGTMTLTAPLAVNGGTLSAADLTVNTNLTVGAFGRVTATGSLDLQSGRTLQVDDLGTLHAGSAVLNSGGLIRLNGPSAQVTGFTANNSGTIEGSGRFAGGLNNGTGGTVRALAGEHLVIVGVGMTNPGVIELSGGTIEYTHALSNLGNGLISGRGTFRGSSNTPGGSGLSNLGIVALSGGFSDFYGDVVNSGTGRIVTAGGAVTTFYDDVTHNGVEIRTNAGARTVFFGSQSGAGAFTGTGTVEYNGDLRPGNSPADVTYEGDVLLNFGSLFRVELGGTTAGSRYDQLTIAGAVELAGSLQVSTIDGFVPAIGDSFTIIENLGTDAVVGTFAGLAEGAVFSSGGYDFRITYVGGTGNDVVLAAVPEPGTIALLGAGLAAAAWGLYRRGRRGNRV